MKTKRRNPFLRIKYGIFRFYKNTFYMQFLSKEIEALAKRKKSNSLLKNQISCGIFQDLEADKLRAITKKKIK